MRKGDEVFILDGMIKDRIAYTEQFYLQIIKKFVFNIYLENNPKEITTYYKSNELIKVSDYRENRLKKIL